MIDPASHRQLFLDDSAVWKSHGIRRTLHQPDRWGPVIRPDRSRGETGSQSFSVPQWNPEKNLWEWWYWAHGPKEGSPCLYVTSEDGVHWDRPSLGVHQWRGSTDNNVAHPPGVYKLRQLSELLPASFGPANIGVDLKKYRG